MQIPLEISFENLPADPTLRALIEREAAGLERFHHHITGCRVTVRAPGGHHRTGEPYEVHIRITMPPHQDLVIRRNPGDEPARRHPEAAIRDAFDVARRRLQDAVRTMEGAVKSHVPDSVGRIARFLAGEDCGFIETADGAELYFHRNSVVDGAFDRLRVGDEVRYVEALGEKGAQASTVRALGRHHPG